MVFFAILFVLHNKSYYWLSQFVTAPSKGVAFHDILRFTFFCSFLLSHNGLYRLCLFLATKLHFFFRITFGYINYLPFLRLITVAFVQRLDSYVACSYQK